jgi:hypothetical protein
VTASPAGAPGASGAAAAAAHMVLSGQEVAHAQHHKAQYDGTHNQVQSILCQPHKHHTVAFLPSRRVDS